MTVSLHQLLLYAGGMALLWAIPGPVWVALTARALSGGFNAAWPLAVGVAVGDSVWPMTAIFGLSWILAAYGGFLAALQWVAAATFALMGILLLLRPARSPSSDSALTRPGLWAGIATGVAAVIGNPKAILFYMGVLPGFFDLSRVTWLDIAAILVVSTTVPMIGNLGLALFLDRARSLLSNTSALRRLNVVSGVLLIGVGIAITLT